MGESIPWTGHLETVLTVLFTWPTVVCCAATILGLLLQLFRYVLIRFGMVEGYFRSDKALKGNRGCCSHSLRDALISIDLTDGLKFSTGTFPP